MYQKLKLDNVPLRKLAKVTTGIKPYQVGKGVPAQTRLIVDEKPFTGFSKHDASWLPVVRGTEINRYITKWNGEFIKSLLKFTSSW